MRRSVCLFTGLLCVAAVLHCGPVAAQEQSVSAVERIGETKRKRARTSSSASPLVRIIKKIITLLLCVFLVSCAAPAEKLYNATAEKPAASNAKSPFVDEEFARRIITMHSTGDDTDRKTVVELLCALDRDSLDRLKKLIADDIDDANAVDDQNRLVPGTGRIVAATYGARRLAIWVLNAINDRMGLLEYDVVVDASIGAVVGGGTARFHEVRTVSGQKLIVAIGVSTLEERNGAFVYEDDWECYPNRVRLFLLKTKHLGPNYYYAIKINTHNKEPAAFLFSLCKK